MTHKVGPFRAEQLIGLVDPQGRKTKRCKLTVICPTLRAQIHGNPPCAVYEVLKQDERDGTD